MKWGMNPMKVDSHNHGIYDYHPLRRPVDKGKGKIIDDFQNTRATISSNEAQDYTLADEAASQDKRNGKIIDDFQNISATISSNQAQDYMSTYQVGSQDKRKGNIDVKGAGSDVGYGFETQNSCTKRIIKLARRKVEEYLWQIEGGFVVRNELDENHRAILYNL